MPMKTFGEMLKSQRQRLGLTQKQVADFIGMSDAYICSLESDKKSPPPYYTVSAIADVLKLDAEQLWKIAVKHREKHALARSRRRSLSRKRMSDNGQDDNILDEMDADSISDSQVNAFFARPEVRMSAFGLFRRQPEDMTMVEKRIVYQAINRAQEFIERTDKVTEDSGATN